MSVDSAAENVLLGCCVRVIPCRQADSIGPVNPRTHPTPAANIVLAWNTSRMDGVVARLKRDGAGIEEDWLRRIGPAHFSHINFRGTFRFNVERYADVLVERTFGRGAAKPGQ